GLMVAGFSDPLSLAVLKPAGEFGADIVCGDFQGFGTPVSFGGPYVGILSAREEHIRQMPGRLIGQTVDTNGHVGYVMTLTTREQHIRREKATSNICTNQGLIALRATIYLSLLGKSGLKGLARANLERTEAMKREIREIPGLEIPYDAPTFNEFVVRFPRSAEQVAESFQSMGV
ncbi:MAG: glycine dehydrogenase, partial [Alphaproteobacteria bacterium]|nr:glycine dehydrogenase [Alphaproteobacteria bacterium]